MDLLVAGLGNPGPEYARTRHNLGFMVADRLAGELDGSWRSKFSGRIATVRAGDVRLALFEPQTYMNLSGGVLVQYARRPFWAAANDLLVLVDDAAIPLGTWRLRAEGGAGGHNGLKSIQQSLGTQQYARLRIGVGDPDRPPGGPMKDFVLGALGKRDTEAVRELFPIITEAIEAWARGGIKPALDVQSRARA